MAGVTHPGLWVAWLQVELTVMYRHKQHMALGPSGAKAQTVLLQPLTQLLQLILAPANSAIPQTPTFNGLKLFGISPQNGHTVFAKIQTPGPALFE